MLIAAADAAETAVFASPPSRSIAMNPPQISVIIPVFNVEKFLPQCLDSVTGQTFADIEIICVNDGSTDKSPEILSRYADRDPRIRIISRTNGGLSAARNAGLKIARGKYIFFIDSDDWIEPNTLEKLFATAESTGADLTCVHFRAFAETENDKRQANGKQSYFDQSEQTPEGCRPLSDNPLKIHVVVNGKLHKKSIIEKFSLSFPHERLIHEDEYWAWAYGIHCQSYSYLPDPLYHYRIHRNSITGTEKNSPRPLDIIDINLLTAEEIRRYDRLEQYLPQLENIFLTGFPDSLAPLKSGAEHYGEAHGKWLDICKFRAFQNNSKKIYPLLRKRKFRFPSSSPCTIRPPGWPAVSTACWHNPPTCSKSSASTTVQPTKARKFSPDMPPAIPASALSISKTADCRLPAIPVWQLPGANT